MLINLLASLVFSTGITGIGGQAVSSLSEPAAVVSAHASATNPPPTHGDWELVWSDEFSEPVIDASKWSFEVDCWGGGNDERQCYTDSTRNAAIEDGKLVITARAEGASGPSFPPDLRTTAAKKAATSKKPFTSARMTTKGKASWRYGRIDVRAKLPQGQGVWPAIWMLPESNSYGQWAASGEIDILEAVNLGVRCKKCPGGVENTILGTLHFGGLWPNNKLTSTEIPLPGSLDEFHIFSIIWRQGRITWLVDGKEYATKGSSDWSTTGSDNSSAPFDQNFHLLLNLAIGGGLPEGRGLGGVSKKGFPKRFEVDFVRIWKCPMEPASGHDCISRGIE